MRTFIITTCIAAALIPQTAPAMAQDWLKPLENMVEDLMPAEPQVRPAAAQNPPPVPPPVPRPRPPSLPDAPAVAAPEVPPPPPETPAIAPTDPRPTAPNPVEPEPEATAPVEPGPESGPSASPESEPEVTPAMEPQAARPAEPDRIYQAACPAVLAGLVEAEMAPPLSEGICGEQSPLIVTGVLVRGRMVPLSSPATTNCQMASALPDWAETVDGYASAMLESPLAAINTGTSYMCRNRNNGATGFISEHGFANAVDVTGFTLEDGRTIEVESNWLPATEPAGRLLRLAHDAACGDFTTVLGPEANAEHEDHLHLDLGCHGRSCRALMCE